MSEAKEYMRAAKKPGINIEKVANSMMVAFSTGIDFFESIAKYRAARRMWAKMMRKEFCIENPKACRVVYYNAYGREFIDFSTACK